MAITVGNEMTSLVRIPMNPRPVDCLVCETDNDIETSIRFSSTTRDYELLVNHLQLIGHDYSYWKARCSGKLITFNHVDFS